MIYYIIAASGNTKRGQEDPAHETGTTDNVRLGDQRATGSSGYLRSSESALGFIGQQDTTRWWSAHRTHGNRISVSLRAVGLSSPHANERDHSPR